MRASETRRASISLTGGGGCDLEKDQSMIMVAEFYVIPENLTMICKRPPELLIFDHVKYTPANEPGAPSTVGNWSTLGLEPPPHAKVVASSCYSS